MSEDKAKSKPATELKSTNGQAVTFPVTLELDRLDGERVQITFQCKFKGKRAWSKERREYTDALRAAIAEGFDDVIVIGRIGDEITIMGTATDDRVRLIGAIEIAKAELLAG